MPALPPVPEADTSLFAADYAGARAGFLAALAGQPPSQQYSRAHPCRGPDGGALAVDTAWYGPADAPCVLVTQSALHGVEGFVGSAAQRDAIGLLAGRLPPGVAVLHIHAINPWGFAWLRRTDDAGIDLNRNFIDFAAPLPDNAGYAALADALVPADLAPATLAAAAQRLQQYRDRHGQQAYELAVTGGQYSHPLGLFHGGRAPAWSQLALQDIAAHYALATRRFVAVVDFHTGLGPFGYGEPICDHAPGSRGARVAREFYGASVTEPLLGTSTSVPKHGLVDFFWHALLPERCCFITLEFGTWPLAEMFPVLQADHWLHAQGPVDWQAPATQRIKQAIRHHFYPATRDWQEMVLFRCRQVLRQACAGLAGMAAAP